MKRTKRIAKIVAGFGLLAAGVAMLALPGPGWLTIAAGLAILAAEFPWARRLLDQLKTAARSILTTCRRIGVSVSRTANRFVRLVTERLWKRDRLQMRAADKVLSAIERRERLQWLRRKRTAKRRRRTGGLPQ